jgi:hypothetical protein
MSLVRILRKLKLIAGQRPLKRLLRTSLDFMGLKSCYFIPIFVTMVHSGSELKCVKRNKMYDSYRELVEALRATPETLQGLLQEVTLQRAREARGGDEGWSVIEVVCHLRDTEAFALQRMQTIRDEAQPLIEGFDQEAWARERDYAGAELAEALAEFGDWRTKHAAALAALLAEQWERTGQHAKLGTVSISNHTLHLVWHDAIHLAQIARQLGKGTTANLENNEGEKELRMKAANNSNPGPSP